MKITLSFEKTSSSDVSIMVDVLRASTTITLALDKFKKIIPCFTPEDGFKLKKEIGGVLAGERGGAKIEGFDIGNSPSAIRKLNINEDTLILTTSNGTRILEGMKSKVLIGSIINAEAVALKSLELADTHIDVVMAGVRGEFAVDDFLAAGEIITQIKKHCKSCELSEYATAGVLAAKDYNSLKEAFMNSRSAKRLKELGYDGDVELCLEKNISQNVGQYINNEITLYR